MIVKIRNNHKINSVIAPASKSYAQRALFAAALSHKSTRISNFGKSDDVLHILEIIQQLGATISHEENAVVIHPKKNEPKRILNCGESGLGIRLTTTIASTFGGDFEIIGSGSLAKRPMTEFENFLPQLGVQFSSQDGFVPLKISGALTGGHALIDGSISSQYLSGLLMSLPLALENSKLEVTDLNSIPYIDMTLSLIKDFGIDTDHDNYKTFNIKGKQSYISPAEYLIEGDWSGAAFWIVYGAISNPIEIQGLNENSLQADRAIMEVLDQIGADYKWENGDLRIQPSELNTFDFNANHCPDLFPILATLAASIEGESIIHGVNRLIYKESNRAEAIQKEFHKLGLSIDIEEDSMKIKGSPNLKSARIHAHNDHRIAMSLAIASVLTPDGIEIENAEAVDKSYPEFWDIFTKGSI